jgi:hypothetical protein
MLIFWGGVLLFILFSIFLVVHGIYRFTRSETPSVTLATGFVLWLVMFLTSVLLDGPFLGSFPFGVAVGIVPYVFMSAPDFRMSAPTTYAMAAIGCILNVIAILNIYRSALNRLPKIGNQERTRPSRSRARDLDYRSTALNTSRVAKHLAEAHIRRPSPDLTLNPVEGFIDNTNKL